jgi:hypothetical protein
LKGRLQATAIKHNLRPISGMKNTFFSDN